MNAIVAEQKRQVAAKYGDAVEKARLYDEGQEAAKSEQQKLTEQLEQALKDRDSERIARERAEVAAETGVPAEMLQGKTRDELTSSATRLTDWRAQAANSGTLNPSGGFYSGGTSRGEGAQMTAKQQAAAAVRDLRKQQ